MNIEFTSIILDMIVNMSHVVVLRLGAWKALQERFPFSDITIYFVAIKYICFFLCI